MMILTRRFTLFALFLLALSLGRNVEGMIDDELLAPALEAQDLLVAQELFDITDNTSSDSQQGDRLLAPIDTDNGGRIPPGGDPNLVYYTIFFNYTFQLLIAEEPRENQQAFKKALKTVENAVEKRVKQALKENDYEQRVIIRIVSSELLDNPECNLSDEDAGGGEGGGFLACSNAKTALKTKVDTRLEPDFLEHVVFLDVQKFVDEFNAEHTGSIKAIYGGPIYVSSILVLKLKGPKQAMTESDIKVLEDTLMETYTAVAQKASNPGIIIQSVKVLLQEKSSWSDQRRRLRSLQEQDRGDEEEAAEEEESAVYMEVYVRGTCSHGFTKEENDTAATADGDDISSFKCTDESLGSYAEQELAFNNLVFKEGLQLKGEQDGSEYFDDLNGVHVVDDNGNTITSTSPNDPMHIGDMPNFTTSKNENNVVTIEEEESPYWIWILIGVAAGIVACGICAAMSMVITRYQDEMAKRSKSRVEEKRRTLIREDSHSTRPSSNRRLEAEDASVGAAEAAGAGVAAAHHHHNDTNYRDDQRSRGPGDEDDTLNEEDNRDQRSEMETLNEEDVFYDFDEHHASENENEEFDEEFSVSYDRAIACGAAAAHAAEDPSVMENSLGDLDTIISSDSRQTHQSDQGHHGDKNQSGEGADQVEFVPSFQPISEDSTEVYLD